MAARIQPGAIQCQRNGSILTPVGAPVIGDQPVRLVYEDFEDDEFVDGLKTETMAVVASNPYSGTRCARVNLMVGADDQLIANAAYNAGNPLAIANTASPEYQGFALRDANPVVRTIKWKIRFDDCVWKGYNSSTHTDDNRWDLQQPDRTLNMKGGWFWPTWYGDRTTGVGFYTGLQGGDGGVSLGDNDTGDARGDGNWYETAYWTQRDWNHVRSMTVYQDDGVTPYDFGPGTGWHEFKMVVDASHPDFNRVRMYIDNRIAVNPVFENEWAGPGDLLVPKSWNVEQFSMTYSGDNQLMLSEDRTEKACGIQIDEIEIWAGEV